MLLHFLLTIFFDLTCLAHFSNRHLLATFDKLPNFKLIINLTKAFAVERELENFIIYSNRKHILTENTLDQALAEQFQIPTITWGRSTIERHREIIGCNGLVFVQFTGLDDPLLNAVVQTSRDRHSMPYIFILDNTSSNTTFSLLEMERFFLWCWGHYLVHVLLVLPNTQSCGAHNLKVYKYKPFPRITIENVSNSSLKEQVFFPEPSTLRVHGFKFFTPMYNRAPYVFLAPDLSACRQREHCPEVISGVGGRFYKEYIRRINGTIEYKMSYVSYFASHVEMTRMVENRSIDIGIMPTSDIYVETIVPLGSYPIWHVNACVIVPYIPEIFYGDYVRRTFSPVVWLLVITLLTALVALQALILFFKKIRRTSHRQHTDALSYAIGRLVNQPILASDLSAHGPFYRCWQLLISLMCFVLINMYTTTLTSLLSTTLYDSQINTMQEFLDSELTLVVSADQKRTLLDNGRLSSKLLSKTKVVPSSIAVEQKKAFNTSYAFVASSTYWQYLNLQQSRLRKPLFRIPGKELCTREFFVKFPMRRDSPFMSSLTMFTRFAVEAGLTQKWNDMNIIDAVRFKYFHVFQEDTSLWKPLSLEHYAWAFWLGLILLLGAFISFSVEVLLYRRKNRRQ